MMRIFVCALPCISWSSFCLWVANAEESQTVVMKGTEASAVQAKLHAKSSIRGIALPTGRLFLPDDEEQEKNRQLGSLEQRPPTGFLIKFKECSSFSSSATNTDDKKDLVDLEVCPEYKNAFGGPCQTITGVAALDWLYWHHKYLLLVILQDFCQVCHDQCPYFNNHDKTLPDNVPDVCLIKYAYDNSGQDYICNDYCNADEPTVKDPTTILDQCADRRDIANWCPEEGPLNRELGIMGVEEDCMWQLYEAVMASCDTPGYPFADNSEITNPLGTAWLRCQFDDPADVQRDTATGSFCREMYYQMMTPPELQTARPVASPSPTAQSPPTPAATPRPTVQYTPLGAKQKDKSSLPMKQHGTGRLVGGVLLSILLLGGFVMRHPRRFYSSFSSRLNYQDLTSGVELDDLS